MQGQAVGDGSHAVLAHPKAEVALLVLALLEVAVALHEGHVAGRQIGRATDEPCTGLAVSLARHARMGKSKSWPRQIVCCVGLVSSRLGLHQQC